MSELHRVAIALKSAPINYKTKLRRRLADRERADKLQVVGIASVSRGRKNALINHESKVRR